MRDLLSPGGSAEHRQGQQRQQRQQQALQGDRHSGRGAEQDEPQGLAARRRRAVMQRIASSSAARSSARWRASGQKKRAKAAISGSRTRSAPASQAKTGVAPACARDAASATSGREQREALQHHDPEQRIAAAARSRRASPGSRAARADRAPPAPPLPRRSPLRHSASRRRSAAVLPPLRGGRVRAGRGPPAARRPASASAAPRPSRPRNCGKSLRSRDSAIRGLAVDRSIRQDGLPVRRRPEQPRSAGAPGASRDRPAGCTGG